MIRPSLQDVLHYLGEGGIFSYCMGELILFLGSHCELCIIDYHINPFNLVIFIGPDEAWQTIGNFDLCTLEVENLHFKDTDVEQHSLQTWGCLQYGLCEDHLWGFMIISDDEIPVIVELFEVF